MKRAALAFAVVAAVAGSFVGRAVAEDKAAAAKGPLDYTVKDVDGKETDLSQYKGKVVLIVNVASKCGYTKQYAGLEKLYRNYKDKGLVVLGFPANNFKNQEPGTDAEIKEFCSSKYDVTFPIMSKISVKGEDKHPVYKALTEAPTAAEGPVKGDVAWNFNKFLVAKDGKVLAHYDSKTTPEDAKLIEAIEAELAK